MERWCREDGLQDDRTPVVAFERPLDIWLDHPGLTRTTLLADAASPRPSRRGSANRSGGKCGLVGDLAGTTRSVAMNETGPGPKLSRLGGSVE